MMTLLKGSERGMSLMYKSQNDMIQEHLAMFKRITKRQALQLYSCDRLAARISDLRHDRGLKIRTVRKHKKNKFGKVVTYVVYELEEAA